MSCVDGLRGNTCLCWCGRPSEPHGVHNTGAPEKAIAYRTPLSINTCWAETCSEREPRDSRGSCRWLCAAVFFCVTAKQTRRIALARLVGKLDTRTRGCTWVRDRSVPVSFSGLPWSGAPYQRFVAFQCLLFCPRRWCAFVWREEGIIFCVCAACIPQ